MLRTILVLEIIKNLMLKITNWYLHQTFCTNNFYYGQRIKFFLSLFCTTSIYEFRDIEVATFQFQRANEQNFPLICAVFSAIIQDRGALRHTLDKIM